MSKDNLSAVRGLMAEIANTPEAVADPVFDTVDAFMREDDPVRTVKDIFYIMEHTIDYFEKLGGKERASQAFLTAVNEVPSVPMMGRRLW